MKNYFFDSIEVLKKFKIENDENEESNRILLKEGFEEPPEDVLFVDEILQSEEPLGFKVYRSFDELGITKYGDYHIVTEYPEQYNGIVADRHILRWNPETDTAEEFHSDLIQLINKGYAKTPLGMKLENNTLVKKTVEESDSLEEKRILANEEVIELKEKLSSTDYVVIKIAEGEATTEEYSEVLAERKEARHRINALQAILKEIKLENNS